jgi:hypothetical protein
MQYSCSPKSLLQQQCLGEQHHMHAARVLIHCFHKTALYFTPILDAKDAISVETAILSLLSRFDTNQVLAQTKQKYLKYK